MEYTLFYFFSSLLITCSINVVYTKNSINAVFFLILSFCNAVGLLFLIEVDYIGLLFLLVYVGAIAILFLFVIIILNLKDEISKDIYQNQNQPINFDNIINNTFLFFLFIAFSYRQKTTLTSFDISNYYSNLSYNEWYNHIDSIDNIASFSQTLYTFYFYYFLVAGLILLVAIIGAITLTSKDTVSKQFKKNRQNVYSQLSRNSFNAVYLLNKNEK